MKRLVFFILIVITIIIIFSSCTYNKVNKSTEVPYGVMDTILVVDSTSCVHFFKVETDDNHFYFDENKVLVEKYTTKEEKITINIYLFVIGGVIIFIVGCFIGASN